MSPGRSHGADLSCKHSQVLFRPQPVVFTDERPTSNIERRMKDRIQDIGAMGYFYFSAVELFKRIDVMSELEGGRPRVKESNARPHKSSNVENYLKYSSLDGLVKSRHPVEKRGPGVCNSLGTLHSGFRRNDEKNAFATFYEFISLWSSTLIPGFLPIFSHSAFDVRCSTFTLFSWAFGLSWCLGFTVSSTFLA
jgi:hypothetical protein